MPDPKTNTNIDIDFIVNEYGALYQQRGQGLDRIKRALIQKAVTLEKYATHKRLTDDIYEMANDEFQPVLQPFRVPFEPKGGVKFHPNKIVLQHIKVDLEFSPDRVIDSWLGFLEGNSVKREQWPITKYMIEVYLKKQIDYDREVNAVYYGERDDDGTSPSSCMDGIRKHLIDGANSKYPVNVISGIRKLQPDTCFDQVEAFSKKIKGTYRNAPIIICVAQDYERAFLENKRANGFYWLHGPEDLNASVDFTKQVVMGLPSMGEECGDMFAFVRGNLLWCTRKDKFSFDVQKQDRFVKILGDWREGIGFGCNKMVWTTEETVSGVSIDVSEHPQDGIVVRNNPLRLTSAKLDNATLSGTLEMSLDAFQDITRKFVIGDLTGNQDHVDSNDDVRFVVIPDSLGLLSLDSVSVSDYVREMANNEAGKYLALNSKELFRDKFAALEDSFNSLVEAEQERISSIYGDGAEAYVIKKYGSSEAFFASIFRKFFDATYGGVAQNGYIELPFIVQDTRGVLGDIADFEPGSTGLLLSAAIVIGTDLYASAPVRVKMAKDSVSISEFSVYYQENNVHAIIVATDGSGSTRTVTYGLEYGPVGSDGEVTDTTCTEQTGSLGSAVQFNVPVDGETSVKFRGYVKSSGAKIFTPWNLALD